jgi:hypothetical protein
LLLQGGAKPGGSFFLPEHVTDDDASPTASDELADVALDSDDMVGTFEGEGSIALATAAPFIN